MSSDADVPRAGGSSRETQASVHSWCEAAYPGEDIPQKVVNLVEEVVELAVLLGVSQEALLRTVQLTVAKSHDPVGDPGCIRAEVGDIQLSICNLAESLQVDAGMALDEVMGRNRQRSLAESAERAARKRALGLTGSAA